MTIINADLINFPYCTCYLFLIRTADGDMFVVKDPERFAAEIIPQYFDQ